MLEVVSYLSEAQEAAVSQHMSAKCQSPHAGQELQGKKQERTVG
jgi:hypothetical protein